ncbi:MAG: zinc-binding dehydrogenase [Chloroflexi bacterium]|nr:zinc-binding dehydrogenase [Chloroflexota bacterium]MCL5274873.1 zinc-binding dehydrogenase [Chloroflexota bacterium]
MRAIVNTGRNKLEMLELPAPQPGSGQVRIRTGACGICATDLVMLAGWERTGYPATPGHEWSGTVDAVGAGVDGSLLNRRCVADNVWSDGGEVGFEHPGGYGQYFLTEAANLQLLPDGFAFSTAALIEPLAVCVRAMHRLGHCAGPVLVSGDGPIGLLMTALLAHAGVKDILTVGGREQRLALARDFGASQTLNYHTVKGELANAVRQLAGLDFPTVIEATGSASAMQTAFGLAAREGKLLILGDYGLSRADIPWNAILIRELTLLGSNASAGSWQEAVRLAVNGHIALDRLVTHRLPARQFAEGVAKTASRSSDVIKVILDWE